MAWPEKWDVAALEGATVKFSSPEGTPPPLKLGSLGIREPQLVGTLESEPRATPYLLVTGSGSNTAERGIYIVRADGGLKPQRLTFPGRLLDPTTRKVVYDSRAFYGRCLIKQKYDALVVFQREHLDRKHSLQSSVYIAEAAPTMLEERLLERGLPSVRSVETRVRSKQCREISGKHRPFDLGFFSLRSRRGSDLPDSESDDDDKQSLQKAEPENETEND